LRGRFFAADVDDVFAEHCRNLQKQRRFACAGRTADEGQAAGYDAAAEHGVEFM